MKIFIYCIYNLRFTVRIVCLYLVLYTFLSVICLPVKDGFSTAFTAGKFTPIVVVVVTAAAATVVVVVVVVVICHTGDQATRMAHQLTAT